MFGFYGCSSTFPVGSWSFPFIYRFAGHLSPLAQLLEMELARLELWDDCIGLYDDTGETAPGYERLSASSGWTTGKSVGGYHGSELGIPHQFPGSTPYYGDYDM